MINKPSKVINTLEVFGTKCNFEVLGFDQPTEHVPEIDSSYRFDPQTTIAILAGLQIIEEFLCKDTMELVNPLI